MSRVLIERIGGDVSQGIARCMREGLPNMTLVGIDRNPDCGWQAFVDDFIDEGFSSDHEPGFRFPRTIGGAIEYICRDKIKTQQYLHWLDIPTLWTSDEIPDGGKYPFIFKPRYGQGSKDVVVVYGEDQARHLKALITDGIFQEYIHGSNWKEITCPVYRFRDGSVKVLQLERQLMGGFTFWAKVVNHYDVEKVCTKIANGLGVFGAINIQMKHQHGSPKIFEINPRFSSTVYMRHKLGFTDAVWAVQEALGLAVQPMPEIKEGQVIVRVQDAAIVELKN